MIVHFKESLFGLIFNTQYPSSNIFLVANVATLFLQKIVVNGKLRISNY